jgi:hypothetical protein
VICRQPCYAPHIRNSTGATHGRAIVMCAWGLFSLGRIPPSVFLFFVKLILPHGCLRDSSGGALARGPWWVGGPNSPPPGPSIPVRIYLGVRNSPTTTPH